MKVNDDDEIDFRSMLNPDNFYWLIMMMITTTTTMR